MPPFPIASPASPHPLDSYAAVSEELSSNPIGVGKVALNHTRFEGLSSPPRSLTPPSGPLTPCPAAPPEVHKLLFGVPRAPNSAASRSTRLACPKTEGTNSDNPWLLPTCPRPGEVNPWATLKVKKGFCIFVALSTNVGLKLNGDFYPKCKVWLLLAATGLAASGCPWLPVSES